jgi:hypothetical protein
MQLIMEQKWLTEVSEKLSPHKQFYDAIKYAEKKDVLIVHAAGNDAKISIVSIITRMILMTKTEFGE